MHLLAMVTNGLGKSPRVMMITVVSGGSSIVFQQRRCSVVDKVEVDQHEYLERAALACAGPGARLRAPV